MKLSSFTASSFSGIRVFKPIQYLHIQGRAKTNLSAVKIRVRVVNSENGRIDEIVPLLGLDVLGEIASMNEGFFMHDTEQVREGQSQRMTRSTFKVNVMLHPTSAVYLSNDKFLEIDIQGLDESAETIIYGLERPTIDKEFVCRYNKFYISAGELQKTFSVGENENLILPDASFEEVILQYKNGSSCCYTRAELGALMMLQNDVVSVPSMAYAAHLIANEASDTSAGIVAATFKNIYFGFASMYGLDVSDVENVTIRRSSAETAFEFVFVDTLKE